MSARLCAVVFDIDGVIRDVSRSYRRALAATVHHYSGWRPDNTHIDALKSEGCWNNDWDASLELLRRRAHQPLPEREEVIRIFSGFYFGPEAGEDPGSWTGCIRDEPLLVAAPFFAALSGAGIQWGFVSGAEPASARFVLESRLGLADPPLIAMGDAPDKPDPTGLIRLSRTLIDRDGGAGTAPRVAYLGDTVADVLTVQAARREHPAIDWLSLAVPPPHLNGSESERAAYAERLRGAGADRILTSTTSLLAELDAL
nr:TIGR01548 family HAD-type hydrolase [Synechococcus sp. RSCCF101]